MPSFYKTLKDLVPPGDLYVRDTAVTRVVIRQFGMNSSRFKSDVDGQWWLDVPFAYEPFWDKKRKSR